VKPYGKYKRTNDTSPECRVGTNKCIWCDIPYLLIAPCPRRLKVVEKVVAKPKVAAKPFALAHQGPTFLKPAIVGRAYVMSKKEVITSGTVVIGTLYLNSKPFCYYLVQDPLIHLYPLDLLCY